jgi:hypothetical protein
MQEDMQELRTASGFEYLDKDGNTLLEVSFEDRSDEFSETMELNDLTVWRPCGPATSYGHVTLLPPSGTPQRQSRAVVIDGTRIGDVDCTHLMPSLARLLERAVD